MDATQFLLSTAVTITTILLIIVSIQLISLLKQLKKDHVIDKSGNPPTIRKKDIVIKKRVNLHSLLEKIKNLSPHKHLSKKKFFKTT